jgi:hypothetical protein
LLGKHNQPTKVNELNVNYMKLTSPNDIAEGFNTFFSNIGPNLAEKIAPTECHFKDYLDKRNYRPISALPAISKVMERINFMNI